MANEEQPEQPPEHAVVEAPAESPPPEEEVDELIGRSVGSYVITKPLGKGGMGAVYAAEHPVIGSKVAIKFLHPQYATDKKIVDRFFNEARAVNVIGHDNILKILDLNVTEDNRHYFIMEYLVGRALQKLVEDAIPVPLSVAGPIMLQFCEALEAAHSHKIYHRDIKPDNVYLIVHKGRKNFVKVVDFGIAKLTDAGGQSTGQTQTGMVMGTPAYMSPEQAGGMTNRIDARSDIYSTGVLMFHMATGKLPFPGSSFGEVLIGHLQLPPPNPRELNPAIPAAYEAVILKALAKQQEARQQTMKQLEAEIKAVMDAEGISAELPVADEKDLAQQSKAAGMSANLRSATASAAARAKSQGQLTQAARPSSSQPGQSMPTPPQQHTIAMAPPPAPVQSNTGLIAGIAVAVLILIGGVVGFAMHQQGKRADAELAAAAERAASKAREDAARVAKEEQEKREATEKERAAAARAPTKLLVVSDPLGATAQADWKAGDGNDNSKIGTTPFEFMVPKDSKVKFVFKKQGFLDYPTEIIANEPQGVTAKLLADPRTVAAPGQKKRKPNKGEQGKPGEDDPLNVDF